MTDSSETDTDYYHRRLENLGCVFPVPVELKDGEHLRDAVIRSASQNGYRRTNIAIDLAKTRSFRSLGALTSTAAIDDIERLVDVLGIRRDAEQLKQILLNGNSHSREFSSFFGQKVRRSHFTSTRRVSPTSLRKSAYQKAVWSIRWLSFDPETMEHLIDQCPVCQCALGWELTNGVQFCGICRDPKVDLRDFPQSKVEAVDEEALWLFANLLNPHVSDVEFDRMHLMSPLRATRGEGFEFIVRIAMECERFEAARRGGVVMIQIKNLERAARALLDWPNNFLALMDSLSPVHEDTRVLNSLRHDSSISTNIRGALNQLLEVRQRRRALASLPCGSKDAFPKLATPAVSFKKRGRAALWDLIRRPDAVPDRIEATVKVVRDIKLVRLRSERLGLTVPDIIELYLAGFGGDLHKELFPLGIFPDAYSSELKLEKAVGNLGESVRSDGISLATAKFILDENLTSRWSDILLSIIDGRLPVSRAYYSGRGLMHDLVIEDFAAFRDALASASLDIRFRHVAISIAEMGMQMGKSRTYAATVAKMFDIHGNITAQNFSEARRTWALGFELDGLIRMKGVQSFTAFAKLTSDKVRSISHARITAWARAEALSCLNM